MGKVSNRTPWQPHELVILAETYQTLTKKAVKELLNNERCIGAIYNKAKELGIKKSKDVAARTQFKKGFTPWNKGVPKSTGIHQNSRKTQFKKGRLPQDHANYRPIGSIRFCKRDGLLYRKVSDDRSLSSNRGWEAVHRLVWIEAHGQIPPGHVVRFKKGQKTIIEEEITLDKIECIPRRENMDRNSYWKTMPREVAELYQLKGAITRQINKIANPTKPNLKEKPND